MCMYVCMYAHVYTATKILLLSKLIKWQLLLSYLQESFSPCLPVAPLSNMPTPKLLCLPCE